MARSKYTSYEKDIMKTVSNNLKKILASKGMTQVRLAELSDLPTSTVGDYYQGNILISPGNLQKIADALGVAKSDIDTTLRGEQDLIALPVYEGISCGKGAIIMEEPVAYELTPKGWINGAEHFYLRAKGDSMIGARIQDGDLLLIRRQPTVENGEIAAVIVDGEAVLKRVFVRGDMLILQSENPKCEPKMYKSGDIVILGKLKKTIISF